MQSVYELAERWSRLWEEDPARMVEEVYASNVVVSHAGRGDRGKVHGRRELHRAERELHELIPDHRNEIIRVVDGGDGTAVVESLITGTGPGDDGLQSCPACVWWRLDGQARVTEEIALYEWGKRRPHDGTAGGTVVSGDGRSRSGGWYRDFAERLAELWSTAPEVMVKELYSECAIVERLGEGPEAVLRGQESLLRGELELLQLLPTPQRCMTVVDVTSDRDVMAVRFTIRGSWRGAGPVRQGPGFVVLTLDDEDRIISDRIYWHWSRARVVDG